MILPDNLRGALQYVEPIRPQRVSVCSTSDNFRSAAMLDRNQPHQPKRCHRRNDCTPGETNLVCKCLVSSPRRIKPVMPNTAVDILLRDGQGHMPLGSG